MESQETGSKNDTKQRKQAKKPKRPKMQSTKPKKKALWDDFAHKRFIELCMKEIDNGNRPGTHFNRNGWKNLLDSFNTMIGRSYDRLQLKNHWDSMKRDWQNWDSLTRGESGLRWDPIHKTVDATDEWWDEKIQRNPNLAKFRHRSLEMYKIYYDPIFRDITGAGFQAFASGQGFPPQDSGIGSESFELPDKFYDENGEEDENTGDNGDVHITPTLGGFSNEDSDYGIHFILPHPSYPLKRKSVNCTPQSNKREPLKVAPLNQHFGNKFHFHSRRTQQHHPPLLPKLWAHLVLRIVCKCYQICH